MTSNGSYLVAVFKSYDKLEGLILKKEAIIYNIKSTKETQVLLKELKFENSESLLQEFENTLEELDSLMCINELSDDIY